MSESKRKIISNDSSGASEEENSPLNAQGTTSELANHISPVQRPQQNPSDTNNTRFPKKYICKPQTMACLLWLGTGFYINCVCQVMLDHWFIFGHLHIGKDKNSNLKPKNIDANGKFIPHSQRVAAHVLPDLGFTYLPHIDPDTFSPDVMLLICGALWFIGAVVMTGYPKRGVVVRRHIFILGLLFFFRGFSLVLTPLPPCEDTCKILDDAHFRETGEYITVTKVVPPTIIRDESFIYQAILVLMRLRVTCCDLLYSGHTTFFTLFAFSMREYFTEELVWKNNVLLKNAILYGFYAVTFAGLFACITGRLHYSVDIYLGCMIATLTWNLYHVTVQNKRIMNDKDSYFLRFLNWIESANREKGWNEKEKMNEIDMRELKESSPRKWRST